MGYTYDNNPAVSYSIGRLTQVTNGWSTTNITGYDPLGRVTGSQQILAGQTYNFAYGYNLAGSLTSETYPSGRVVNTSYDLANRVNGVAGVLNNVNTGYVTSATYAPHGAPTEYRYGNNLWRDITYNNRLQPLSAADTVTGLGSNTHLYQTWSWGTNNNNGNLQSSTASHGGPTYQQFLTFNDSYLYDGVNRLAAVYDNDVNNNPLWARIFGYDRYGNMSLSVNSGVPLYGTTPTSSTNFNTATNRLISGATFDAAGNQTEVGSYSLGYDAENRQTIAVDNVSEGQASYGYDGSGQRVTKSNNGLVSTLYVYDIFGQLAAEYNSFGAQQSPCATCYLSYDHLGSVRMVTVNNPNADIIARHDYLPFGEEIPANTAGRRSEWGPFSDKVDQKFTGQERDDETGFDFFQARYFYPLRGVSIARTRGMPEQIRPTRRVGMGMHMC